jgi:DMSO/TMAO reductase YedYZ molybdopterin-dependent catalytic subunit
MVAGLRSRSLRTELRTPLAATRPEPAHPEDPDSLVALDPAPPTLSRRGLLAVVGGSTLLLGLLTAGQTIGGPLRKAAILLPRGRSYGDGPNDFQINRTSAAAAITDELVGPHWRLNLTGGALPLTFDLDALHAMPQHTAELPLACVEGWSSTQVWSGVRLRDLAAMAGVPAPTSAVVRSVEPAGAFNVATLTSGQVLDPDSLLATEVNGAPLSRDHGAPCRVIAPAVPGVHCTKWVGSIEFRTAA